MPNMMQGAGGPRGMRQRPEASEVAKQIFSKLDTDNQGYLEASDFASAISKLSSSGSDGSSASSDEVFASLDGDSDGKVTQDELTQGIKSLQEQLDSQFNAMRMQGGMQGMGGAHPHHHDGGQTQDEGMDQNQLGEMASAASQAGDSRAASMFSQLASNFTDADADGDGKVTFSESIAYQHKQQQASSSDTGSTDDSASAGSNSASSSAQEMQSRMAQRLMEMMRAYDDKASPYQSSSMRSAA
jgi:Ca2+-binding EF-hand superfamily protein